MKISTITQRKVGPYTVTVTRASDDHNIVDTFRESSHRSNRVVLVLDDCEEDYRDPEMSHEDMLERLCYRLLDTEGVTRIDIVGVNDGCGVGISLEG